jgi:uncharacterized damage-inducible protein DinB
MEKPIKPLIEIVKLNSRLFLNCFDGVDDAVAVRRMDEKVNNMAFVAVHLADARVHLVNYLGKPLRNPFEEFTDVRSIDEVKTFPSVEILRTEWKKASSELEGVLLQCSSATLSEPSVENFPLGDKTKLGVLAFILQHESYHIGQLALLRKHFGLAAMKYE